MRTLSISFLASLSTYPDKAVWAEELLAKYKFTAKNTQRILQKEVGSVFAKVLEYAGVYKRTPQGREAFERFLKRL